MIMILTLLPAESDAAKKLADLTADGNVLAVAASKISDFGSDSLSGDSGKKDGQDAKEDESSQPEEEGVGRCGFRCIDSCEQSV